MSTPRAATTRDFVLLAFAIVLLIVAGTYIALRGGGEDLAPDDQFLDFRCQACGETFRLSYREFEKLWNERRFTRQADGRTLLYECPKCGQMKAERVVQFGTPREQPD
jgi:hypothetical protein